MFTGDHSSLDRILRTSSGGGGARFFTRRIPFPSSVNGVKALKEQNSEIAEIQLKPRIILDMSRRRRRNLTWVGGGSHFFVVGALRWWSRHFCIQFSGILSARVQQEQLPRLSNCFRRRCVTFCSVKANDAHLKRLSALPVLLSQY